MDDRHERLSERAGEKPWALLLADAIEPPQFVRLPEALANAAKELRRLHTQHQSDQLWISELHAANLDCVAHFDALMADYKKLETLKGELVSELKDIRDNYDHDEDAHKYGTRCRACVAAKAIAKAEGESNE